MRCVVTAMGGLVPELFLLIRELSRRFDRISVLLGPEASPIKAMLCRPDGVEFSRWSPTSADASLTTTVGGADAVVHLPPRSDETLRTPPPLTLRSIACVAQAIARSNGRPRSFISLVRADEGERDVAANTSVIADAGVRTCVARFGVVLRAPTGPLGRMLCAFRTQGASTRVDCQGAVRWIHVLDAVRAVAHVLENNTLSGRVEFMAPECVSVDSFAKAVWSAYGLPGGLRGPAAGVGRLLHAPPLDGGSPNAAATPRRLIESGFSYLFPDLTSALTDIAQTNSS
jgi:uncharacterized protein